MKLPFLTLGKNAPPAIRIPDVTTYDVLKSVAVVLMILDHIGLYFYNGDMGWRIFGRCSIPIWLFLIGYARSRRVDNVIVGNALLLSVADIAVGRSFLGLNILWSVAVIRLVLDKLMTWINGSIDRLFLVTVTAIVFFPLTNDLFEYGTLGLMFAMSGHMARRGFGGKKDMAASYLIITAFVFTCAESVIFSFNTLQVLCVAFGIALSSAAMLFYLPRQTTTIREPIAKAVLHFGGRHTLLIYVVHLLLFAVIYSATCGEPTMAHLSCRPLAHLFSGH